MNLELLRRLQLGLLFVGGALTMFVFRSMFVFVGPSPAYADHLVYCSQRYGVLPSYDALELGYILALPGAARNDSVVPEVVDAVSRDAICCFIPSTGHVCGVAWGVGEVVSLGHVNYSGVTL